MPRIAVLLVVSLAACAHAQPRSPNHADAVQTHASTASWARNDVCCAAGASRALLPFMNGGESDDAELRARLGELADAPSPSDQRMASLNGLYVTEAPARAPIAPALPALDASGCAPCAW